MKKAVVVASIVVLGAGGWAGASWYTGKQLESRTPEYQAKINDYLAELVPGLTLTQTSYERGLLSSTAHYVLGLAGSTDRDEQVDFDLKLDHGPFPASALARGQLMPVMTFIDAALSKTEAQVNASAFALTKGQTPIQAEGTLSYRGDLSTISTIAAVNFQDDTAKVDFGGAKIRNYFVRGTREIDTTIEIETLAAAGMGRNEPLVIKLNGMKFDVTSRPVKQDETANTGVHNSYNNRDVRAKIAIKHVSMLDGSSYLPFQLAIDELNLGADYRPGSFGIPLIDTELRMKRVETSSRQENFPVALDNVRYAINLSETKTSLAGAVSYSADGLTVDQMPLGKPAIGIKLNNLDGAVSRDLMDLYQRSLAETPNSLAQYTFFSEALDLGMRLLDANPELHIEPLSLKTDNGESNFSASIVFTKPPKTALSGSASVWQPLLLSIKSINAKAVLSQPMLAALATNVLMKEPGMSEATAKAKVVKESQTAIGSLKGIGFAEQGEGNLVATFHYAGGIAKLNDQVFSPDQIGMVLGMGATAFGGLPSTQDDEDEERPEMPPHSHHAPAPVQAR